MDLFGEHSVQVVAATQALLEAALVLTLAALLVLLSVRVAQQSASTTKPALAIVPALASRIAPPGPDADDPSARRPSTSLPSRAPPPPDPSRVTRVQPPAPPASGQSHRAGGVAVARTAPPRASA